MTRCLNTKSAGSGKRRFRISLLLALALTGLFSAAKGQGIHFSQYYNTPMLLNPANTGLMPENDYRVGINYRKQWAAVPVPYNTFSAYGDLQLFRNRNQTNWLGLGLAVFNDNAGDGNLKLVRWEGFAAYHIQMGLTSMISVGLSGSTNQRSVDFAKLTFGAQWDGFKFDGTRATQEPITGIGQSSYMDVGAGINYAYFPNENVYLKIGAGVAHLNTPTESFYGMNNQIGMRPTGNADLLIRANPRFILNPSVYYSTQRNASELVYGSLFRFAVSQESMSEYTHNDQLILGAFNRWNESVIGVVGVQWSGVRIMANYDFTISKMNTVNRGYGALEFSLVYEGLYGLNSKGRQSYNCPRF